MEQKARSWLESLKGEGEGWRCLAQNFRTRGGEVDLIFEQRTANSLELVFVEVRARRSGGMQSAIESIGFRKRLRLRRAIALFLAQYQGKANAVRMDALCWDGEAWQHYLAIPLD